MSRYQKGKTNLDSTEARDSGISWAIMQVCTSLQTDNHASTPRSQPLSFYWPDALPAAQPTASKHWKQVRLTCIHSNNLHLTPTPDRRPYNGRGCGLLLVSVRPYSVRVWCASVLARPRPCVLPRTRPRSGPAPAGSATGCQCSGAYDEAEPSSPTPTCTR